MNFLNKKNKVTALFLIGLSILLLSAQSYAALTTGAVITRVGGDLRNNDLFAIQLDKDIVNGVCQRNNVLYLDPADPAQKALIAVAITAQVQGQTVTIIDTGTCDNTFNGSTVGNVALIFADA